VFAEYVGALESMGAWGWAIRNRADAPLLIDAFLSYRVSDVSDFYATVAGHDGDLASLLRLPPTQAITDVLRKRGAPHGGLLSDFYALDENLKTAATHYFHPQEIFVLTYNKAKHGAPIVEDPDLPPDGYLLMGPNLDSQSAGRYAFYKFGSGDEIVAHTNKLVRWVSRSTQALVAFAEKLKTDGLLYETGAHGGAQSS